MNTSTWLFRGLHPALAVILAVIGAIVIVRLSRREAALVAPHIRQILLGLRMTVVAILLALLVDVGLHTTTEKKVKPELLLLIDGSASMALEDAQRPAQQITAAQSLLPTATEEELRSWSRLLLVDRILHAPLVEESSSLLEALEKRFELVPLFLGENTGLIPRHDDGSLRLPKPVNEHTDLGRPVLEAITSRPPATLGAAVLITDGRHNHGRQPEEVLGALKNMGVPLFTVGVGSAVPPPDLAIERLEGPRLVFADEPVKLSLTIRAAGLEGLDVPVQVYDGGELIEEYQLEIAESLGTSISVVAPLELTASRTGRRKLTVSIPRQPGESVADNNQRALWIEIFTEKIKVLLIDGAPRWEYRYLSAALDSDASVAASSMLVTRPPDRRLPGVYPRQREALFSYDVVILGDVERTVFSREDLANLRDYVDIRGRSLILIAGPRAMPASFGNTALEELLPVSLKTMSSPGSDTMPESGLSIRLTGVGERSSITRLDPNRELNLELWSLLPPQQWHATHAGARPGAEVLAVLSTRAQTTEEGDGLMVVRSHGAGKVFFSAIDATWAWRFRVGEEFFTKFWKNVLRWAIEARLPPGDDFVRLGTDHALYESPEEISIRALINNTTAGTGEAASIRTDAVISRSGAGEVLRQPLESIPHSGGLFQGKVKTGTLAGELPPGEYEMRLESPRLPGYVDRPDRATARFAVMPPPSVEQQATTCHQTLLTDLASRGAPGGRMLALENARALLHALPRRTVSVEEVEELDQWAFTWPLLILLVVLLTVEWSLRKRHDLA